MRALIDLEEDQLRQLDAWALRERISRAEAVRRAVKQWLTAQQAPALAGFGLWREAGAPGPERDGLAIERELRDEWPE